jgi:HEAT repeat protein
MAKLVEEYRVGQIVVGLPLRLDGRLGEQAQRARAFGERLEELTQVPVEFLEECWTSVGARRIEGEAGADPMGEPVASDSIRAALLLHSWALGDTQNPAGVELLIDTLRDPNLTVRFDVALGLARIGSPRATRALVNALDADSETAEIAASALGHDRSREGLDALLAAVRKRSDLADGVRLAAIHSLGRLGGPDALGALRWVLETKSRHERRRLRPLRPAAVQALGQIGGEGACEILERHAARGDRSVRMACRAVLASGETQLEPGSSR